MTRHLVDLARAAAPPRRAGLLLVAVIAVIAVAACTGDDGRSAESGASAETSKGRTRVAASTTETATTPPATTEPSTTPAASEVTEPTKNTVTEVSEQLGVTIAVLTRARLVFTAPEEDCLADALDGLNTRERRALRALVDDPIAAREADPEAAAAVLTAYLDCLGPNPLSVGVALSIVKATNLECVAQAWRGTLTGELVASSLIYGSVLDDLPDVVVDGLASSAAACERDRQWWVDDILFQDELEIELGDRDSRCVAERYVDTLGVAEVIRRRLLGAPLLAVPPAEEARLDLLGQCGVTERGALHLFAAEPGACVQDFRLGTDHAWVGDCAEPHDAEVFSVYDLAAEHPEWPGVRHVVDDATAHCRDAADTTITDVGGHDLVTIHPLRRTWEQGDRSVICVLVHDGDEFWTGPSGLIPTVKGSPPPTSTVPPAAPSPSPPPPTPPAAAPGTTLPPGAREMFSLDEITRPGTCIYRAPALPGQADLERRFFEVDCAQPHQAEMYHRFVLDGAPGAPYPGDAIVTAQAEPVCTLTFAAYVGVPYEESRLRLTYFYPSLETWFAGDRSVVCFLVGTQVDEMFTRPMAGTGQ